MTHAKINNFRNFKLCDTHIHMVLPETLDSTEKTLREIMEYYNYGRIGLMCLTSGSGHNDIDPAGNVKALYIKDKLNKENPDSVFVYAHPYHFFNEKDTSESFFNQAKNLYEMGVDGYKFLNGKPQFRKKTNKKLCDRSYDKMYEFIEEKNMPVKMHVADPIKYWGPKETMPEYAISQGWWCGDGTYPSFQELHDEVYGILNKFPKLKFCAAHCFYLADDLEQLTMFLEKWENTSFDLTPGASSFVDFSKNHEKSKEFLKKYSHRIFFGTDTYNQKAEGINLFKYDNYWTAPSLIRNFLEKTSDQEFEFAAGPVVPVNMDDEVLENIYFKNHEKLHPTARSVNNKAVLKECERLLKNIEKGEYPFESEELKDLETDCIKQIIKYFE